MRRILALLVMALALIQPAAAYSTNHYAAYQYAPGHHYATGGYLTTHYIGPARTGLYGRGYTQTRFRPTNGRFTDYLRYTHRAYSDARIIYARPYVLNG